MEYSTTSSVELFEKDLGEILSQTAGIEDDIGWENSTWFPNVTVAHLIARRRRPALVTFQYRVVPSFYLVLCVIGLVGNGVVIKVLWSIMARNVMKSVTDILVINLAVADFIFVGSLPFWATELFLNKRWVFGTVGCKLMSFITLLNLYGSVFFLVAMGIDRYLAVVYAVRARNYRTPRKAVIASAIIWAFASLIGLQALIWRKLHVKPGRTRCIWALPDELMTTYYVIRMAFGFFVPFIVIVYCYILIILKLHSRVNKSSLTGSSMTNKQQKITRAILAVISLFVVCWLPNHIVTLILAVTVNDKAARSSMDLSTANLVSVCLAYANSSINPILYAFMKEEIRQEGTEMIVRFFTCCKRESRSDFRGPSVTSKTRGLKLSFWRSTRHTMMAVVPRHSQAEVEMKSNLDNQQVDKECKNADDSFIEDTKKSDNSGSSFPTTPGITVVNNGHHTFDVFRDDSNDREKVNLVVKMDDI
uniref:somatostatin receptor type 5-like isoform X1 n=1 Tax=Styela clava TaxID=7725 RepID=UPI00193A9717|nr:somatostatin receptor type 5-like isoform X1 [Styela clava]